VLRLEKEDAANRKIWENLPSLNGLNVGLTPTPGAQVLATYDKKGKKSLPLIVAGMQGKGRSMAVGTDSTWNWNFKRVGEGGSGRYYQKFWNNVLAWLTNDLETRRLQLETDRERYREGEQVLIKLKLMDDNYNPAPAEKVSMSISAGPNVKKREILVTDKNGHASYQYPPESEGFFTVRAEWKTGDRKVIE
jgi:hypothetical protein